MEIIRTIDGKEVKIELTSEEIYEAHKVFVIDWMIGCCQDILSDYYKSFDDVPLSLCERLGKEAYTKYEDEEGTEWECCSFAVDDYLDEHPELTHQEKCHATSVKIIEEE